ncbi:MAG TPA: alpha/beta fold hydrolase [Aeromicrobium sp.]|nr:alpha/beta fold hydrolase [Aeromicrobium sp.]
MRALPRPLERLRRELTVPQLDIPEGRWINLPGRGRTWLIESGASDAPALILLHAVGCTGALTWFPVMAALSERYRVITFDQRWHGRGIMSDRFAVSDCADDVAAVIAALHLEQPIIAGYSMGGVIAQRTWRQHPTRVGGLVLAATTSHFRGAPAEMAFHQGMELGMRAVHLFSRLSVARAAAGRTARALNVPPTETGQWALAQWNSTSPLAIGQAVASLGRHNSRPWLTKVDVPTAVVVTTKDRVIPPERQRDMAWRIPGATVHETPCGHAACVLEADAFVPTFTAAVDSVRLRLPSRQQAGHPAQR